VHLAFIFIASGGLLFGYIIGVNSNIITTGQLLCTDDVVSKAGSWSSVGYDQCYKMNALEQGLFSSLSLIGATMSSLICFRFSENLGRKREVQIAALLYLAGAACAAACPVLWAIYLGILLYGLGIGFAMHAAPVYIAEISPAEVRGTLVAAKEAVIVLGMFLGFLFGFIFSSTGTYGWRFSVLISGVFALVMEIGIAFIPESPRFLVLRAVRTGGILGSADRPLNEARASLKFFRGVESYVEIEDELQQIYDEASSSIETRVARTRDAFRYPRPLFIGCGIVFLQQVTGQPSVLYDATNIFKSAGFGNTAALSSVGVGIVKLIATLFTAFRVDKYGRRLLLFIGIAMMTVALAALGTAFMFQECKAPGTSVKDCDDNDLELPRAWAMVTVGALMVYVSGYQIGFGPISWLLISEVFPLNVRGAALSIAAIINFGMNILMTLTQGVLQEALTACGVFYGYCGLALVSIVFVWRIVPETKGKTLEQIEGELTGRLKPAQDASSQNALTDTPSLSQTLSSCSSRC
jgi:sugar porter (SP) family MFS transporter